MKNIIIRLEEDVLKFYEDFAVKTNRSRKKEIEILVTSFAFNKLMEETGVKIDDPGFDSVQFGEDGPKYKVPNNKKLNITIAGKKLPKNQFKIKDKTITLEKPLSRTEQMKKLRK